jgi:hypothetical protein
LFVLKCPICEPVRSGFVEYGAAKGDPPKGKGIPKDIVDDLKNPARLVQLKALERLVDRYVASHKDRLKLTDAQRRSCRRSWRKERRPGWRWWSWVARRASTSVPPATGPPRRSNVESGEPGARYLGLNDDHEPRPYFLLVAGTLFAQNQKQAPVAVDAAKAGIGKAFTDPPS